MLLKISSRWMADFNVKVEKIKQKDLKEENIGEYLHGLGKADFLMRIPKAP